MIKVISSPFQEDENLPWEYNENGFLAWYEEVFLETYKKDVERVSVLEATDDLEARGYVIEVNDLTPTC